MSDPYSTIDYIPLGKNKNKTQIILAETKREYKSYIQGLKYRYNKKNPYLPNYVISKYGKIIKILEPECYSNFMEIEEINKNSIIICLENYGWLKKNILEDSYSNWIGDIYKKKVFKKKWREYFFWDIYNNKQIKSLSDLIFELCNNFNIPKEFLDSNVKKDEVYNFKGIVSKSNFNIYNKDVNPSFNFKKLKQQLDYYG